MNITITDLVKKDADIKFVKKYQLSGLENIDWDSVERFVVYDNSDNFLYLVWLCDTFKIKNIELVYKDTKDYFGIYEYDNRGLKINYFRTSKNHPVKKFFINYEYNKQDLLVRYSEN